jgi:hypothetical protein
LEGSDQYLPLPVLIAVCRFPKGAGHFPEEPAKFAFIRGSLFGFDETIVISVIGFMLQRLGGKRRLVLWDIGLYCQCHQVAGIYRMTGIYLVTGVCCLCQGYVSGRCCASGSCRIAGSHCLSGSRYISGYRRLPRVRITFHFFVFPLLIP